MATGVVQLLEVDPDLGATMAPESRRQAAELIRLPVVEIERGPWVPSS